MENKSAESTGYFPLFVDISGKKILVVGAGTIGSRRVKALLGFGADLTVVAPKLSEELQQMADSGMLTVRQRKYESADCLDCWMVLAASDDPAVNEQVCKEAKAGGAIVNNASDRKQCDFHFPGLVKKGQAVIGINAGGNDHRKAKELRIRIEESLGSGEF